MPEKKNTFNLLYNVDQGGQTNSTLLFTPDTKERLHQHCSACGQITVQHVAFNNVLEMLKLFVQCFTDVVVNKSTKCLETLFGSERAKKSPEIYFGPKRFRTSF